MLKITICLLLVAYQFACVVTRQNYAMYVWTTGWDPDVIGCDATAFSTWDSGSSCFTHTWNTVSKREWLWNACNNPGREVSTLFVSGTKTPLKSSWQANDCSTSDVLLVKALLTEGHNNVPNLQLYALFSDSDPAVSEQNHIKYVVWYNDVCASNDTERFDGVAVNNEAIDRCASESTKQQYLDGLKNVTGEAGKQVTGTLKTHYSMGWLWSECGGTAILVSWQGNSKVLAHHMIDIFDSTDVQVAFVTASAMADRLNRADYFSYDYARENNKGMFTTVYINKADPCQTSFFPVSSCSVAGNIPKTEAGMFAELDKLPVEYNITNAPPCLHYFRGVYSSGGPNGDSTDWPRHAGNPSPTSTASPGDYDRTTAIGNDESSCKGLASDFNHIILIIFFLRLCRSLNL